jgi:molybdate transport system permease protein
MLTPEELEAFLLSLRVAGVAVLAGLPPALFCAYALARWRFPGKLLFDAIVHLPLVLPPVVVGYLLLVLFGRQGPLGQFFADWLGLTFAFSWRGAVLAAAIMGFPFQVRAIRLSLEALDPGIEAAARTLGASRADVFLTVTLPLILPGVLAGALLCFAGAVGEFGATITFVASIPGETQTLPLAIFRAVQSPGGEAAAARLVLLSIALALLALGASELLARRWKRRFLG